MKRSTGLVLFLTVTGVAAAARWWDDAHPAPAAALAPAAIPVRVATAERRDVPDIASTVGTVESLHSVTLRPQVDGVLTAVLFSEGQAVERGQLLARIDDRAIVARLAQARAEVARDEAQLKSARIDLDRYDVLLRRESVPRQTFDQQAAQVAALEASIAAGRAAVAAAEVELSYTVIESPLRGRVGLRRIDPGNVVHGSDADGLVNVTQIDPIAITFALPETLLPRIRARLRDAGELAVEARAKAGDALLARGRLALIDNQIDTRSGTVRLKAEFANTDEALWPGQFVTVQVVLDERPAALVVPAAALQFGVSRPFVYRLRGTVAERVPVTVALQSDALAVIEQGIEAGDRVVIDGQSRLRPGSAVEVLEATAEGGSGQP